MAALDRAVVVWTGFQGGPGVSIFYAVPGGGVAAALRTFFEAIKNQIPTLVQIQVPGNGDTIDDATGDIIGTWTTTAPLLVDCTGLGSYSAPVGSLIKWKTDGIVNSHRVQGRTFLVPGDGDNFDAQGQVTASHVSIVMGAANALVTAGADHFAVWSRPTATRAGSTHLVKFPAMTQSPAVLTSRRD